MCFSVKITSVRVLAHKSLSKPVCKSTSKWFPQKKLTNDHWLDYIERCWVLWNSNTIQHVNWWGLFCRKKKTTLKIRSPTFTAEKASVPPHEPCQPASSDLSTDHRSSVVVQPMATVRCPTKPETVTGSLGWYMLATTCFVDRLEMVEQMSIQPTQVLSIVSSNLGYVVWHCQDSFWKKSTCNRRTESACSWIGVPCRHWITTWCIIQTGLGVGTTWWDMQATESIWPENFHFKCINLTKLTIYAIVSCIIIMFKNTFCLLQVFLATAPLQWKIAPFAPWCPECSIIPFRQHGLASQIPHVDAFSWSAWTTQSANRPTPWRWNKFSEFCMGQIRSNQNASLSYIQASS